MASREPRAWVEVNGDEDPQVAVPQATVQVLFGSDLAWVAEASYVVADGHLVMERLRIGPAQHRDSGRLFLSPYLSRTLEPAGEVPEAGLTSRLLREVPFDRLHAAAERGISEYADAVRWEHNISADLELEVPRRTGRAGTPDGYYAVWAVRYAKVLSSGSRSPIKDLAETHELKREVVRDLIRTARERGLLEGASHGRASGRLTAKGQKALEQWNADQEATR